MATATKMAQPIVPVTPTYRYVLDLDAAEAQVLVDIFNMVGGDPRTTRRGLVDGIRKALNAVAVYAPYPLTDLADEPMRGIYFKPTGEASK